MLDHIAGRPSAGWQRTQVVLVSLLTLLLLIRDKAPFEWARRWNGLLSRLPPWKIVTGTLLLSYLYKNFFLLLFLNAPEPLSHMYTHSFYRTTWILTSLDAGFFTAMSLRPKWLRDILSVVFSLVYVLHPDAAEEKVRKYRAYSSLEILRVSWEKAKNPYIRAAMSLERGSLAVRYDSHIPRPKTRSPTSFPDHILGPIPFRLYSSQTIKSIQGTNQLIFMVPGGGFVSMPPICHDDYTSQWARLLPGVPIVSIDYGKAPENPFPWAIEEVFDAYRAIVESNGAVIGLTGWFEKDEQGNPIGPRREPLRILFVGDSAGANIAVGAINKCLTLKSFNVPVPCGLVMLYPCLSLDMDCWLNKDQLSLLRDASKETSSLTNIVRSRSRITLNSPLKVPDAPREINLLEGQVDRSESWYIRLLNLVTGRKGVKTSKEQGSKEIPTELSMTSRITYFNDRVIPPEVMRAMAIYYLGTSPKHLALHSDYFMSPVLTPPDLLSQFPPTYFLTGERDPFVDDTMIFSSKLRKAGCRGVKVEILEGVSHGVLLFVGMLPVANQAVKLVAGWMRGLLVSKGQSGEGQEGKPGRRASSADEEDEPVIGHRFIDKRRNELASRHLR